MLLGVTKASCLKVRLDYSTLLILIKVDVCVGVSTSNSAHKRNNVVVTYKYT